MSWFSSWFGGTTTVSVSSTVYNLAGDIATRPNFLKTTVLGAVVSDSDIPSAVQSAYLTGPGLRLKGFARWARTVNPAYPGVAAVDGVAAIPAIPGTYNSVIGMNAGTITSGHSIDNTVLVGQIPATGGGTVAVQASLIDAADFTYWVDQYVCANAPSKLSLGYSATIDNTTFQITVTYKDGSTTTFAPVGFDPYGSFLYATYVVTSAPTPAVPAGPNGPGSPAVPGVPGVPQVFIYEKGTGNSALDAFWNAPSDLGSFLPFIPVRIDNQNVVDQYPDTIYPEAVKATKKAMGAKFDDITAALNQNTSLADIDYAYVAFGVCLNTQDNSSKKYIYKFFETILNDPGQVNQANYATWEDEWLAAQASWTAWQAWQAAGSTGTEPTRLPFPAMPINSIGVTSNSNSVMDYNMTVSWSYMFETTGTGLLQNASGVNATQDELWLQSTSVQSYSSPTWGIDPTTGEYVMTSPGPVMTDGVTITWQVDSNNWKQLSIVGLQHTNLIYKGNAVVTLASDALASATESGFLIPLHEDVFSAMGMKDYTQMCTACCYLVLNSYTVTTTPWYATGWFQIILIVVVIVVSVLTFGAGAVGTVGLLGSNTAVGAAIVGSAASATLIAIVGAIANALAAMIVVTLIGDIANVAFGPTIGPIIGGIVSLLTLQIGTGLMNGKSIASIFPHLTSVMTLLSLTAAVGNIGALFIKASIQGTLDQITTYEEQENAQSAAVADQSYAAFGAGTAVIDAASFTSSTATSDTDTITMEPSSLFLSRTLMTGSDIAELSMSMISDFASLTLNLDLVLST